MSLYHEEKAFIQKVKEKISADQPLDRVELLELVNRLEEMTEMTTVTVKIIDRLMKNYDQLKMETGAQLTQPVRRNTPN